jgi:L-asparagine transporter-like permease
MTVELHRSAHGQDAEARRRWVPMNRILLLGYLVLTALVLVFVAMVKDQIDSSAAQSLAVILVALAVADRVLQRRPQR